MIVWIPVALDLDRGLGESCDGGQVVVSGYHDFFAEQIRVQRRNVWIAIGWSAALVVLGAAVTVAFVVRGGGRMAQWPDLVKLGPLLMSTALTTFPCKLLMSSRSRLASYGFFFRQLSAEGACDPKLLELAIEAMKQTIKMDG